MEGIAYFGRHSVDISSWADKTSIDKTLGEIEYLIKTINLNGYVKVKAPSDWGNHEIASKSFWDIIDDIFEGQMDLFTYVITEFGNKILVGCLDTKRSYEDAETHLTKNNPCVDKCEYYGALKQGKFWPSVPEDIHMSDEEQLFTWAKKFLKEAPVNEDNYTERCRKIFPNLIFNPDFALRLKGHGAASPPKKASGKKMPVKYKKAPETGIKGFSSSVTEALSALNGIQLKNKTATAILDEIKEKSGFDCTRQGKNKRQLKISYQSDDGTKHQINCEFHIKFSSNNINDGVDYKERIYFGFLEHNAPKKIFVAHSGKHL